MATIANLVFVVVVVAAATLSFEQPTVPMPSLTFLCHLTLTWSDFKRVRSLCSPSTRATHAKNWKTGPNIPPISSQTRLFIACVESFDSDKPISAPIFLFLLFFLVFWLQHWKPDFALLFHRTSAQVRLVSAGFSLLWQWKGRTTFGIRVGQQLVGQLCFLSDLPFNKQIRPSWFKHQLTDFTNMSLYQTAP